MIFVGNFIQDEKGLRIGFVHYKPFDEKVGMNLPEETLRQMGALVDEIPEPEQREGKIPVMYYNPETNTVYYEYENRPLSPEEEIKYLKELNAELIYKLMMKGAL